MRGPSYQELVEKLPVEDVKQALCEYLDQLAAGRSGEASRTFIRLRNYGIYVKLTEPVPVGSESPRFNKSTHTY